MIHSKQILLVLTLTALTFLFACAAVVFIPFARQSAIKILTSSDNIGEYKPNTSLSATVLLADKNKIVTDTSTSTDLSGDTTPVVPTPPPVYKYKIMRSVDECSLNKMGKEGYQAIQFGGILDASTGHDSTDCTRNRIVDVMDWILFVRQD